jgi:hypothetical protein
MRNNVQVADQFELPRCSAQYVIAHTVGDNGRQDVVRTAQQIHGISYAAYGYVDASSLTDDGRLVPELDRTRDDPSGKVVASYFVAYRTGTSVADAGATVRLLDVGPAGSFEDLPTYRYFGDAVGPRARARFEGFVEQHGERSVREIAALASIDDAKNVGSYELMRAIVQNATIKERRYGQRELYLAALTEHSLGPVVAFVGEQTVEVLSDPIRISFQDPRSTSISVTPLLFDCARVIERMASGKRREWMADGLQGLV